MKYTDARPAMRTGDLVATAEPCFISKMIRLITKSKVSHVAGVIEIGEGPSRRLFICESHRGSGVALVALSQWVNRCKGPMYWFPRCIEDQEKRGLYLRAVTSHLGDKYESDQWMLTRVMMGKKPPENGRWFCSELDLYGRRMAGIDVGDADKRQWPEDCVRMYGGVENAERITK